MRTAVIADQNDGKNGKTNCGNEELAFLASAIKERRTSPRRRLQMQFTRWLRRVIESITLFFVLTLNNCPLTVINLPLQRLEESNNHSANATEKSAHYLKSERKQILKVLL